jgi:16S rRNA (uracil1498-N3)-methyltransferase
MTPPQFLVAQLPVGDVAVLQGAEGRHAARARRIGVGEAVLISDGRGGVAECVVESVAGERLTACVRHRRHVPEPDPRVAVVQALPKGDRAELAVELLTELGADEIVPWAAARSIAQWTGDRGAKALAKWQRTAAEAAKQSRRAWIPAIAPLAGTPDVAARLEHGTGFVLHEAAGEPLTDAALPRHGEIVLVVGPEGGLSDAELTAFAKAKAVRLGEPVLRTSTAGAAALAALSVRLGRW